MSTKEKIMRLFGKALDEAMPDKTPPAADEVPTDVGAALAAIMKRLDAIEAAMKPAPEAPPADELPPEGEKPAGAEGEKPEGDRTPEEMTALEARLATIEKALAKLAGLEMAEGEDQGEKGEVSLDAETIARAEILAPGIRKTADVKAKALKAAYSTEDGKAIIDTLLAGKTFDSADKDMLFVAASEMLKSARRGQLHSARVSLDSLPSMKAGEMTPEKINQINAAHYGKQ